MIRRSAIEGIELNPLGYKILIEVMARGRLPWIGEVPYVFNERTQVEAKPPQASIWITCAISSGCEPRCCRSSGSSVLHRWVFPRGRGHGILFLLSDPAPSAGAHTQQGDRFRIGHRQQFPLERSVDLCDLSANQPGFTQRLRRFCKFQLICLAASPQRDSAQSSVQLSAHQPLHRQCRCDRRRHRLELLDESQTQLAQYGAGAHCPA